MALSPYEEKLMESIISSFSRLDQVMEIIVFGSRARSCTPDEARFLEGNGLARH